jgi:hypothetical protein
VRLVGYLKKKSITMQHGKINMNFRHCTVENKMFESTKAIIK